MLFVRLLLWDDWNVVHIARHEVTPDEVEQVCHGNHAIREGYRSRVILLGPTQNERMLAVILEPHEDDVYYPVTARPASRRERAIYNREREGEL